MVKLFRLHDPMGNPHLTTLDNGETIISEFDNKMVAKAVRNAENETAKHKWHITRGPDHMGRHGHRIARMRLQP